MTERFNLRAQQGGIYGDAKVVKKATPIIPETDEDTEDMDERSLSPEVRKVWFAPVFPRDKLAENLNLIQGSAGHIFQVLVMGNQIQLIYYMYEEAE